MKSIKTKLVLLYVTLVFIVMLVIGVFICTSIKRQESNRVRTDLETYANLVNDQIQQYINKDQFKEDLNEQNFLFGARTDMQLAILTMDGKTLAPDKSVLYKDNVILDAMVGKESFQAWKREIDVTGDQEGRRKVWMSYAKPIFAKGSNSNYIIYLKMDVSMLQESISYTTRTIFISGIIAIIIAVILGSVFANTLTDPIIKLTNTAKEIASGHLNQQIPVFSDDEVGQLTKSFNYMGKNLYQMMSHMIIDKKKIEIILNNMTDGVIAFDSSGRIIHVNIKCKEMLSLDNIDNFNLSEFIDVIGLNAEDYDDLQDIKDYIFSVKNKFLSATFSIYKDHLGNNEGLVAVFQDITKHAKLDNMRKEFVANVSHEIRTPLTIIKTYSETLLDGAMDEKETLKSFLETINSEADRITLLASDLLELSRFDNNQLSMNKEISNLVEILENSIRQNNVMANSKNQHIIKNFNTEEIYTECDPYRIDQVFTNIISNSIKYSPENTNIYINIEESDIDCNIYIRDEGIGIPKDDIDRIFERFYRIDKARSRAMGGTGLGLSIVKEIMDAHDAKIFVESELNVGTTVILKFNKIIV